MNGCTYQLATKSI